MALLARPKFYNVANLPMFYNKVKSAYSLKIPMFLFPVFVVLAIQGCSNCVFGSGKSGQ